jgi:Protein of unknown function (DUF664)
LSNHNSALDGLEAARKQFVAAIDGAPTEALAYLSPGDDYALGGLVTHVNAVLRRYGRVLDAIVADPAAELNARSIDEEMGRDNARSKEGLTAGDRVGAMATLAALHDHVVAALSAINARDWNRKTPVRYGGGEPYMTSAGDITEWLWGHYLEHVPHVEELLQHWRAASQTTSQ